MVLLIKKGVLKMNYEKLVRKLRQNIFTYEGMQEIKAERVLKKAIQLKVELRYRRFLKYPLNVNY